MTDISTGGSFFWRVKDMGPHGEEIDIGVKAVLYPGG